MLLCAGGHVAIVKEVLAKGAAVDVKFKSGATALYVACQEGYLEIVNLLITAGADVNAQRTNQWTPIFVATQKHHADIVAVLLANGAQVNSKDGVRRSVSHDAPGLLLVGRITNSCPLSVNVPRPSILRYNLPRMRNYTLTISNSAFL